MRPNESGTTRVSMSRTIASLNDLRIFVTRSSADSITFDTIRKRSKPCFIPFFKMDVELFMRTYIGHRRSSYRLRRFLDRQHVGSYFFRLVQGKPIGCKELANFGRVPIHDLFHHRYEPAHGVAGLHNAPGDGRQAL